MNIWVVTMVKFRSVRALVMLYFSSCKMEMRIFQVSDITQTKARKLDEIIKKCQRLSFPPKNNNKTLGLFFFLSVLLQVS